MHPNIVAEKVHPKGAAAESKAGPESKRADGRDPAYGDAASRKRPRDVESDPEQGAAAAESALSEPDSAATLEAMGITSLPQRKRVRRERDRDAAKERREARAKGPAGGAGAAEAGAGAGVDAGGGAGAARDA